ncbi:undecaprenyl/decaprenyl-phosphate alpha-N-acetylglucosaminyl 1-phosphate transferase [Synechococcus moorigangaii CMS01]|nr:undecaprenyl/decaprenyl-phosphate alpha-N-acetylglucosaminyl 1-phosphate transferase [Synechococcus moorigangaii CMS01]
MSKELLYLVTSLIALIVVLITTPIVNAIGLRSGRVDQPNARKVHDRPMVRLGGVAIFLGTLVSLGVAWQMNWFPYLVPGEHWPILGVLFGAIAFFGIGFGDDLFELSALSRLLMQFIAAGIAWLMGVQIEFLTIPFTGEVFSVGWLSLPFTLIWLVGMANAINWIDGLDGLAAGVSGIAAAVLLVTTLHLNEPMVAFMAAALAGASLGFLRYNFNPAQIFMGDGGSYFMGFTLAAMGVVGLVKTTAVTAVLLPYVILAVPLIDMTTVVFSRISSGASPFKPDKRHLHHRLLAAGFSHRATVLFIYGLTLWAGSLAIAFSGLPSGTLYAGIISVLVGIWGWFLWRRRDLQMDRK